jgi:hypothetical protein
MVSTSSRLRILPFGVSGSFATLTKYYGMSKRVISS